VGSTSLSSYEAVLFELSCFPTCLSRVSHVYSIVTHTVWFFPDCPRPDASRCEWQRVGSWRWGSSSWETISFSNRSHVTRNRSNLCPLKLDPFDCRPTLCSLPTQQSLVVFRRGLNKLCYHEERSEAAAVETRHGSTRINRVLLGGSSKIPSSPPLLPLLCRTPRHLLTYSQVPNR
jgi:hypothetical protein